MLKTPVNLMPESVPDSLVYYICSRRFRAGSQPRVPVRQRSQPVSAESRASVPTKSRLGMVAALLATAAWTAFAQVPISTTTAARDAITKHTDVALRIAPAQRQSFLAPLWPAGTHLTLRYRKAGATALLAPVTVRQAMAPMTSVIAKVPAALSVSVIAGGRILSPIGDTDRTTRWTFSIPANTASATVVVQNVSSAVVQGTMEVDAYDAAALAAQRAAAERAQLLTTARTAPNPDLLYAIGHMLERHFLRYPGGISSVEAKINDAVLSGSLNERSLRALQKRFATMKPELAQRLKNPSILSYSAYTPLPEATVRLIFKTVVINPTPPVGHRYSIRLLAVKSWRCADDAGWEIGCDREEPYVSWVAQGPTYGRVGRTESAADIRQYSEAFYGQSVNVLSSAETNAYTTAVEFPLGFFFQVIEDDPGGPTREQVMDTLKSTAELIKAIYGGSLDDVLAAAPGTLASIYNAAVAALAGGDDYYQMLVSMFNAQNILSFTSGTTPLPQDRPLFESAGNYAGFSIRIADVYRSGVKQWSVAYLITRQ